VYSRSYYPYVRFTVVVLLLGDKLLFGVWLLLLLFVVHTVVEDSIASTYHYVRSGVLRLLVIRVSHTS